ncbi:MAG: hypothetical protein R2795_18370 [Saprospiraceae bacterium]
MRKPTCDLTHIVIDNYLFGGRRGKKWQREFSGLPYHPHSCSQAIGSN